MRIFYGCERLFLKAREKPARIKRTSVCCLLFILFGLSTSVLADDVEIYTAGGQGVKPNVLIIFDNSESMKDTIPSAIYDSGVSYPGGYPADTVYYRWRGSWDHEFRDSVANITCPEARTALETEGFYNGKNKLRYHVRRDSNPES